MSDFISRQAAIDALKGLPTWWADGGGYYGGAQPPMVALLDPEDAVSAIENLPSVQPETQWIPCSERLPDKEDVYLCCSTAQDIWILRYMMPYYFQEGAFIQFDGDYPVEFSDVIAWMPLPEPYKAERKDE